MCVVIIVIRRIQSKRETSAIQRLEAGRSKGGGKEGVN